MPYQSNYTPSQHVPTIESVKMPTQVNTYGINSFEQNGHANIYQPPSPAPVNIISQPPPAPVSSPGPIPVAPVMHNPPPQNIPQNAPEGG